MKIETLKIKRDAFTVTVKNGSKIVAKIQKCTDGWCAMSSMFETVEGALARIKQNRESAAEAFGCELRVNFAE